VGGPSFWGLLEKADQDDLAAAGRAKGFPDDDILCRQGDETTHVFILLSGWVKITTDSYEGRQALQALRSGGDVVGEIAGQVGYRIATVRAAGMVRALLVGAQQFQAFLDDHAAAATAYRQATVTWQQAAYAQQASLSLYSGPQRLAGLLLDLDDQRKRSAGDDAASPMPFLSQEEMAHLIGASRSTVTRPLSNWRTRGIIGPDLPVEILDRDQMLKIAGRPPREALAGKA
jgi:CRP/FNR family transcriptional regulator, cyclic AMP receptor protein